MQRIVWFLCFNAFLLFGWEMPPQISLKGVLKTATRQRGVRHPDGTEKHWEEKSTVLVPDESITLSRSIIIGKRPPLTQQESPEFIHLLLSEEFDSLKDKTVELLGHFVEPSADFYFVSDIKFDVDTAIDIEWKKNHPTQTVFYEPNITELRGTIYQKIYPGPPEYSDIEIGDTPEPALILLLTEPINVQLAESEEEPFNQPELGVREIHISFVNDDPPEELWTQKILVKGTLCSALTCHHRRRVLMMADHWETCP
jgi:hypothetical protein